MLTQFTASQMIELRVEEAQLPIEAYWADPQRLMYALVEHDRVRSLGAGQFEISVRSLSFLGLTLQVRVVVEIWVEEGRVRVRSRSCELMGAEFFNQRFELNLEGQLVALRSRQGVKLWGKADLMVRVDVPLPLSLTPRPILEATGNALLRSVLVTIQQRMNRQLLADYRVWASDRVNLPVS
jgi:Protein of unknown function (DUF1997)